MKFLKLLDKWITFIVGNLSGILMMIMMLMINVTIFSRYVFNINLQGYEELPTMLFIVFVWLAVILVVRDDNMLKVDFFQNLCKTARAKEILHLISLIISVVICVLFTPLTFKLTMTHVERGTVSAAVGFSMWWVYGSLFAGSLGMTVYYVVNVFKSMRRLSEL
ncbi:TRAP transporter small permease subunit [Petroclostridium sp. X23]|uniref:TRAP transporter small permease n=1 Tax=Petroclostridium sp. X23 TaxID=3045146 RepID=UPI0024AE4E24|nr:TRAP transporter small permease subunit [Petroclostridium sp. X23]WHH56856.1 TRAP transporter small permease subunit [Petroclostridium sp. X23]